MLTKQVAKVQKKKKKEIKISSTFMWQGKSSVPRMEEAVSLTLTSELDSSGMRSLGKAEASGSRWIHSTCNWSPDKKMGLRFFEGWAKESGSNIIISDLQIVFQEVETFSHLEADSSLV